MNELPDFLRVANRDKPMAPQAKPIVWSYTMLNTYAEVCPHQFFHRYITKTVKFVESQAVRDGNEVHTAFEQRLGGRRPFPPHLQHCEQFAAPLDPYPKAVEQWYGITADGQACESRAPNVFLRGKLDCSVIQDTTALLWDWKNGRSAYEKPFELEIGGLLLKARNPYLVTITGRYAYTKENKISVPYDLSDTDRTLASVNAIVREIEQDLQTGQFEKRQSGLCGYCDVRTCEHNRKPA
jgi:hypothetical protein